MTLSSLYPLWPELIIAGSAMLLLMIGVFRPDTDAYGERIGWVAILALIAAAAVVVKQPAGAAVMFDNAFVIDDFGALHEASGARRIGPRAAAQLR